MKSRYAWDRAINRSSNYCFRDVITVKLLANSKWRDAP